LSEDRWVYQLVAGAQLPDNLPLIVQDVITGRGFNARVPVLKWHFGPHEVIGAQARFERNDEPVTVVFRWEGPYGSDGSDPPVHFTSEPFTIAEGNTKVFSFLDDGRDRPTGKYRVVVVANDVQVGQTDFFVE
jgi:hypothetical protein